MRILFTTTGSAGHLGPLLPFADALCDAGEEVLIATRESSAERARATGHAVRAFADAPAEQRAARMAAARGLPTEEANRVAADVFGSMDAMAAYPGVLDACERWRPDVVVSEPSESAGPLAAARLGLPTATVAITQFAIEHRMRGPMEAARRRLHHELGVPEANGGAPPPRLTLIPQVLEHPDLPGPAGVLRFRDRDAAPVPADREGAPLVYVSFGSVVPQQAFFPGLYRATIDALAPLPVRLLVTIGRDRDPAALGPLPENVRAERWVPQPEALAHAAAMVCHGGSGTVLGGLAAGVPLAVLPFFADQPDNAARVAELGAGVALADVGEVAGGAEALLGDRRYEARARAIAEDIRALPTADAAVDTFRALAA